MDLRGRRLERRLTEDEIRYIRCLGRERNRLRRAVRIPENAIRLREIDRIIESINNRSITEEALREGIACVEREQRERNARRRVRPLRVQQPIREEQEPVQDVEVNNVMDMDEDEDELDQIELIEEAIFNERADVVAGRVLEAQADRIFDNYENIPENKFRTYDVDKEGVLRYGEEEEDIPAVIQLNAIRGISFQIVPEFITLIRIIPRDPLQTALDVGLARVILQPLFYTLLYLKQWIHMREERDNTALGFECVLEFTSQYQDGTTVDASTTMTYRINPRDPFGSDFRKYFEQFWRRQLRLTNLYEKRITGGHCKFYGLGSARAMRSVQEMVPFFLCRLLGFSLFDQNLQYMFEELAQKIDEDVRLKIQMDTPFCINVGYCRNQDNLKYENGAWVRRTVDDFDNSLMYYFEKLQEWRARGLLADGIGGGCSRAGYTGVIHCGRFKLISYKDIPGAGSKTMGYPIDCEQYNNCFFSSYAYQVGLSPKDIICPLRRFLGLVHEKSTDFIDDTHIQRLVNANKIKPVMIYYLKSDGEHFGTKRIGFDDDDEPHIAIVWKDNHYYGFNVMDFTEELGNVGFQLSVRERNFNNLKMYREKLKSERGPKPKTVKPNTMDVQCEKPKEKEPFTVKQFIFDFETFQDEKTQYHTVYLAGLMDMDTEYYTYFEGEKCMEEMMDYLLDFYIDTKTPVQLIGYNNSRYDNYYIMNFVSRGTKYGQLKTIFAGNRLLNLSLYYEQGLWFRSLDVLQLLAGGSLKHNCKQFCVDDSDAKSIFPHLIIKDFSDFKPGARVIEEEHFYPKDMKDPEAQELIGREVDIYILGIRYLYQDLKATRALFLKLGEALKHVSKSICGKEVDISSFITLGQFAYYIWFQSTPVLPHVFYQGRHYDTIRESYYGGCTQVYAKHFTSKSEDDYLVVYDVNSLYPYAMHNHPFPTGYCELQTFKDFIDWTPNSTEMYIAYAQITPSSEDLYPCIPKNISTGLSWDQTVKEGWYTSVDIETAWMRGGTIKVKSRYIWRERCDTLFNNYIETLMDLKKKGSQTNNPALRNMAKLAMNGLYGKFGQRLNNKTSTYVIHSFSELERLEERMKYVKKERINTIKSVGKDYCIVNTIIDEDPSTPTPKPHYYAAFITAYARRRMWELISLLEGCPLTRENRMKRPSLEQCAENPIFYMDTDSLVFHVSLEDRIRSEIHGSNLGMLKADLDTDTITNVRIVEGIFHAPKLYYMRYTYGDGSVEEKCKAKGVPSDCVEKNLEITLDDVGEELYEELLSMHNKTVNDRMTFYHGLRDQNFEPKFDAGSRPVLMKNKRNDEAVLHRSLPLVRTLNKSVWLGRILVKDSDIMLTVPVGCGDVLDE